MPTMAAIENHATLRLAARHDDERGEQRTERRAEVAAGLKQRLGEAVAAARRHARDA